MHCTILVKQWQSPKVYTDTPQELALLKLRVTTVIKISQVFPILAFSKAGRLLQKKKKAWYAESVEVSFHICTDSGLQWEKVEQNFEKQSSLSTSTEASFYYLLQKCPTFWLFWAMLSEKELSTSDIMNKQSNIRRRCLQSSSSEIYNTGNRTTFNF